MTELDNYMLRTKADLHTNVRLSKATGHMFISVLRYSPHAHYCRSS